MADLNPQAQAPIHILPADVLGTVFKICTSINSELCLRARQLGQVCRFWHSVVLTRPKLWSDLFVTLKNTKGLLPLLRLCLERSGDAPIQLYVQSPPPPRGEIPEEFIIELRETSGLIFSELLPHSHRWTLFRYRGLPYTQSPVPGVDEHAIQAPFPQLKSLRLQQFGHLPTFFNNLPNLRGVELRRDFSMKTLSSRNLPKLRRLYAEGITPSRGQMSNVVNTSADFVQCFKAFPLLDKASILLPTENRDLPIPEGIFTVSNLRKLKLCDNIQLLRYVELPVLNRLHLNGLNKASLAKIPQLISGSHCPSLNYLLVDPVINLTWLADWNNLSLCPLRTLEINLPNAKCALPTFPDQTVLPRLKGLYIKVSHSQKSGNAGHNDAHIQVISSLSEHLGHSLAFPSLTYMTVTAALTGTEEQVNAWKRAYLSIQRAVGRRAMCVEFTGRICDSGARRVGARRNHTEDVVDLAGEQHPQTTLDASSSDS
ncbi:hypothetical protein DL96DRAFT_266891 [Flagelloscypha sp. PMI_526]|nr:hypothetical protein DL96DRAFT_266891 [Flagelloscypha sp. PMI_526]